MRMNIIEVTKSNASEFEDMIGVDLVTDLSRSFFRGLAAVDEDGTCHGALVYELLGVDSDDDTKSRIRLLVGDDEDIKAQLQDEYRKAASEDDVAKSFFETSESEMASFFEKMGFSKASVEAESFHLLYQNLKSCPLTEKRKCLIISQA